MRHGDRRIGFISTAVLLNIVLLVMFSILLTPLPTVSAVKVYPVATKPAPTILPALTGVPVRLVIEAIGIDLPIDIGVYDAVSGEWTLSNDRAFYANASLPVNNSNGTTLIYGHAQAPIFHRLPEITDSMRVDVYTNNGLIFHYRYQRVDTVVPTDVSVFTAEGPPTLVLQTCTGAWDTYRALYVFTLTQDGSL